MIKLLIAKRQRIALCSWHHITCLVVAVSVLYSFTVSADIQTRDEVEDLAWVSALSEQTHERFGDGWLWDSFDRLESAAVTALNASAEFPRLIWQQSAVCLLDYRAPYNQGRYRCANRADYIKGDPQWRTLVDIAALNRRYQRQWRFANLNCRDYEIGPCILGVTENGTDAIYHASYRLDQQDWLKDGFELVPGRNQVKWLDDDTLLVMDTGTAEFTSSAGYPMRLEKIDRAGSRTVLASFAQDSMGGTVNWMEGELVLVEWVDFFARRYFHWLDGAFQPLNFPHDSLLVGRYRDGWLLQSRSLQDAQADELIWWRDGTEAIQGTELVYQLSHRERLQQIAVTESEVFLLVNNNFETKLLVTSDQLQSEPRVIATANLEAWQLEAVIDEGLVVRKSTLLSGPSRWLISASQATEIDRSTFQLDTEAYEVELSFAEATDGEEIPYLMVTPTESVGRSAPTLIDVYGGFGVSVAAVNNAVASKLWLERGGRLVFAAVRGGGEYGRWWHRAGQREYKNQTVDDLVSVASSLTDRGLSSAKQLAYRGASNGGLVAAAAAIRAPRKVAAVVLEAPLTDMMNYHRSLSGPSWMVEYGNPEIPAEREWLLQYSPIHNIQADESYPSILLLAAQNDDRVDIAHSRGLAERLAALGQPIYYDERATGGHSIAVTGDDIVAKEALVFNFLWETLLDEE
ncbi:prolyl oligopeptidase family serine peptidase [Umboniibacter marinipuniceus]|uniref:Prolyl oligopeptidase n=1 Tax=Umboniibacter marinipuniceus TaxID=569599 RepID=A0A3M0A631_9GAMM|nr:prolyl oligopeptidase family serine peptidase [Umboniibacter marinipuniceus]RMA80057.1 prolyl oligopeptidase [Umboniibacter marinipuniceus]